MNDRVTSEQEQAVMPSSVHKRLKWTMKQWTIQQVIAQMSKRGNSDDDLGRLLHPTDLFGDYVAWLWSDGRRGEAIDIIAGVLAGVRGEDESVKLEELLSGLRIAMPDLKIYPDFGLSDQEAEALLDQARKKVPEMFGSDV